MIHFGTKAKTLQSLKELLKKSNICDSVLFTVQAWYEDSENVVRAIQKKFKPAKIIVRSSAISEDTSLSTMAGYFKSVNNVDSTLPQKIHRAVKKVIGSYGERTNDHDEILVQPMISDVSMSGVIFSHDLNTGAPYYVINYDDISGLTDTITSGTTDTSRTLLVYRKHIKDLKSSRFAALLEAVQEIESVAPSPALDIEFAVTRSEKIYIFQVRRLAVQENWSRDISQHIEHSLNEIHEFVRDHLKPIPEVLGHTSIFGEMPDWNPAELIGPVPRPLAKSLFERLITNSIWAEARADMGYKDLSSRPLMVTLGGRVYIDVRESFNSYLPSDLNPVIGGKLVSAWLSYLQAHPELHDKVEFDVAITAYTFDFDKQIKKIPDLSLSEINEFKTSLQRLTNEIVLGNTGNIQEQLSQIEHLDQKRRQLLQNKMPSSVISLIHELLYDCARFGTKPFSILAREAFIAESFLRSMTSTALMSSDLAQSFRSSIITVLTDFLLSMQRLQNNEEDRQSFMDQYGHLRPGTYDILALRYDQREELGSQKQGDRKTVIEHIPFSLPSSVEKSINKALKKENFTFDAKHLFSFMRAAIAGREYSKLVYTRNISDSLELIAEWGIGIGLNRDELSYLTIDQIVHSLNHTFHAPKETYYRGISRDAEYEYQISQAVCLPYLITSLSDVFIIPLLKSRANFITQKRLQAPLHYLSGREIQTISAAGKLVLIERADPGFDWIFSTPFAGLITKYGGSNSHMAIRCAELGIPAAIGCGEQTFKQLEQAQSVLLDCGAGLIFPIN